MNYTLQVEWNKPDWNKTSTEQQLETLEILLPSRFGCALSRFLSSGTSNSYPMIIKKVKDSRPSGNRIVAALAPGKEATGEHERNMKAQRSGRTKCAPGARTVAKESGEAQEVEEWKGHGWGGALTLVQLVYVPFILCLCLFSDPMCPCIGNTLPMPGNPIERVEANFGRKPTSQCGC